LRKFKVNVDRFQQCLRAFHSKNPINKPWQTDQDPYKIWLFEVIMQQTRMAQGIPYYNKIVETYPSIYHLANADED